MILLFIYGDVCGSRHVRLGIKERENQERIGQWKIPARFFFTYMAEDVYDSVPYMEQ